MSQGSESGREDDGQPQVDIQVPDDARELYQDVLAYHREQRALRRQQRSRQLRRPFSRHGVVLPLIAGCLLLAVLSGVLLTMFTASSYFGPGPVHTRPPAGPKPASHSKPPTGTGSALLPAGTIFASGQPVDLTKITSTAIALVGGNCDCASLLRNLTLQTAAARIPLYLVGPSASQGSLAKLAVGRLSVRLATDPVGVLQSAFPTARLTVLLVNAVGQVTTYSGLRPGFQLGGKLRQLIPS